MSPNGNLSIKYFVRWIIFIFMTNDLSFLIPSWQKMVKKYTNIPQNFSLCDTLTPITWSTLGKCAFFLRANALLASFVHSNGHHFSPKLPFLYRFGTIQHISGQIRFFTSFIQPGRPTLIWSFSFFQFPRTSQRSSMNGARKYAWKWDLIESEIPSH